MRRSVVLPAPLRPESVMRSPRSSLNDTPRSSGSPAMSLPRSDAMRTAIATHSRGGGSVHAGHAARVLRVRAALHVAVVRAAQDRPGDRRRQRKGDPGPRHEEREAALDVAACDAVLHPVNVPALLGAY